jgi:hypothetical protein
MNTPRNETQQVLGNGVPRSIGLHGRVAVLSGMAGGVALGGVLVAYLTLNGRLSAHALFMNATGLFIIGAILGLLHGVVLGYLGRPTAVTPRQVRGDMGRAALFAVPGLAVAWLATIWVAMTLVAAYTGRIGALIAVSVGWVAAGIILAVAALHAFKALKNAYARWPERRAGTLLTAASFAALLLIFLANRPEIWGLRLRLTENGAVLLAAILAVWVAGPMVTLALRLARQVPFPRALAGLGTTRSGKGFQDLLIGLVAGVVVGLLAVPFAAPGVTPAAMGAVVMGVSQSLVNEVLLRLILVTAVAWLLLRWERVPANRALIGAVVTATVVQVALYTPGALAVGFASWTGTVLFLLVVAAIPAAVFGLLFWRRGFASALVADVVALAVLALLA